MNRISIFIGGIFLALAVLFLFTEWYALIPACIILGLAIMTQRALEPLIVGCSAGFMLIPIYGDPQIVKEIYGYGAAHGLTFPLNMLAALEDTIARDAHEFGFMWVILIAMLYGVFIQLLVSSGGIKKLVETSEKFVKTKRDSLIMTVLLLF
jgi:tetracycline resistance efflux pump